VSSQVCSASVSQVHFHVISLHDADGRPGWDIPLNSITVTLAFNVLITMIILGSPVAFFMIGAICNSALYASYLICIGCMVWRRLSGEPLPPSRFNLGKKFGMFSNLT
jgi:amino acid transporter